MESLLEHRTRGQSSGAAVCNRLVHGPFCLVLLLFFLKVLLLIVPGPHVCFLLDSEFSLFFEIPIFA